MRLLYGYLRDKDIDGVRLVALELGAALFAVLNVVLLGTLHPKGAWQYVVVLVGAAVSLTLIVRVIQRLLLTAWGRPVLGRWVYESSSGSWGLARIDIHGGDLRYTVQLYHSEADVLAAVRGEAHAVAACFATVDSSGVTFRGGNRMELVYKVDHTDGKYTPRTGILVLTPLDRRTMKGFWSSDVATGEASRGTLDMRRERYVRAEARRAAKNRADTAPFLPPVEDTATAPRQARRRTSDAGGAKPAKQTAEGSGAAKPTKRAAAGAGAQKSPQQPADD
ncbi:MAG TPA: hypothetical protein VGN37_15065 [Actinocatenispora sp.]